jgi:osmotically-inducible protein OsmY
MNRIFHPAGDQRLLRAMRPAAMLSLGILLSGCFAAPALIVGGVGTGVGAAAYIAHDRRSSDTMLSDQRIQKSTERQLNEQLGAAIRIEPISFNRNLLLVGEARDQQTRQRAAQIAAAVDSVREVFNEVEVTDKLGFRAASEDASITAQVKARLVGNEIVNPLHVSVATENHVVYLMGLVTHREGDEAARVAASTRGVSRVVRVFEYIPDSAAQREAAGGSSNADKPAAESPAR